MKIIVGLGNPGNRYRFSRHNIGFLVVDELAAQLGESVSQKNFKALTCKVNIGGEPAILAKPQTYMNLSGTAVKGLFDFYKIDFGDLIIIHDDLDLPFTSVRLKVGGGHGGHKGLNSIIDCLGGSDFIRVRLGIDKPFYKGMVENYVLEPFSLEEAKILPQVIGEASDAITAIVKEDVQKAMNRFHGKINTISNLGGKSDG